MGDPILGLSGTQIDERGDVVGAFPVGRKVGEGKRPGTVGTLEFGRATSRANIRLASKFWPEGRAEEFIEFENGWLDLSTHEIYDQALADPLLAEQPSEQQVDVFIATGSTIKFLRKRGQTIEELELERQRQAREQQAELEKQHQWRRRQKQVPLTVGDLRGNEEAMTLAEAARVIEECDGKVERGQFGQVTVTLPERLHQNIVGWARSWRLRAASGQRRRPRRSPTGRRSSSMRSPRPTARSR